MRTILVILAAVAVCLAIDGATTPYNFSPATKAYSSQVNANFDSLRIPLNKMKDTLNLKMVRYAKVYRNHDSTFQWMNIDTIKGPVRIDTANIDTAYVGRGVAITAGLTVGAALSGLTGSFSSWIYTADSVLADRGVVTLGPVKGATGVFTSAVTVDSLKSTKGINATTGTFSGTVTVDSLKSTKGISYAGAGINTTNGIFSGKVTATDSMRTSGSMRAATGTFTSTLTVDSLKSTKGTSATTGTFSGTVTVDSLKSTKGINVTTGAFSGTVTVDSLKSTKGIVGTSLTVGSGDPFSVYTVSTFACTTTAGYASDIIGSGTITAIGRMKFIDISLANDASNSASFEIKGIPSSSYTGAYSVPCVDNGNNVTGSMYYTGSVWRVFISGLGSSSTANWTTSGQKGFLSRVMIPLRY